MPFWRPVFPMLLRTLLLVKAMTCPFRRRLTAPLCELRMTPTNRNTLPMHGLPIVDEAPALLTRSNVLHLARVSQPIERVTDSDEFAFEVEQAREMTSVVDVLHVGGWMLLVIWLAAICEWVLG